MALQSRNTIEVNIGLRNTKSLVDTGSQITLISHFFLKSTEFKDHKLSKPDYDVIKGVSNNTLPILGKILLPFEINHKIFWNPVHVVKGLNQTVIIGVDFMERHNVSLHYKSKTIQIADSNNSIPIEIKSHFARTAQKIVVPPKHEMIIPVKISKLPKNQKVYLEPCENLITKQLLAAKTIACVQNRRSMFKVCNPTVDEIVLGNNTIVATIECVHDDDIIPFKSPQSTSVNVTGVRSNQKNKQKSPLTFDLTNSELNDTQKSDLQFFLKSYRDVFANDLTELGKTVGRFSHKIETYDAPPIRMPFYRQPPHLQKEIDRQVQELLENDIVEESNSEYHSPVVLVKKKDGKYRFCVDYRKLNKFTKPLSFPLPRLECVFDTIAEAESQIFSTFDLHSGYWQLQMDPETKHKAAFITQNGVYEWKRLGMGLKNSCVSFQMAMSQILRGLHWKNMLVYVDDICVFSKDFESHLNHLKDLFGRLRNAGLTLNPKKCNFAAKEVKFLGHLISKQGIQVDPNKTKIIDTFPIPQKVKDIRSFLGMCNYYRRFIKSFSTLVEPLNKLLRKDEEFIWTEACQVSFETLKRKLTSAPILAYPNMNKPFILTTDASNSAIGYILSQKDKGNREHVIAYGGRSLSKPERNWSASDVECLAVIEGIREYKTYLSNNEFLVFTDHKPLQYLMSQKSTTGRLARWSLELQGYNFKIIHKEGKSNVVADALSRRTYQDNDACNKVTLAHAIEAFEHGTTIEVEFHYESSAQITAVEPENIEPNLSVEHDDLGSRQKNCSDFKNIYLYLESETLPDNRNERKKVIAQSESYSLCNGVLYHWFQRRTRKVKDDDRWIKQLALPKTLRSEALSAYHDNKAGGAHFGVEKVMAALKRKYYWPRMHQEIYDYIQSCDRCQRIKKCKHNRPPPLTSMPIDGPFARWHIDFLKLSKTTEGYQYLLLVVDSFTRWVEAFPLKTQESKQVAQILFEQIFSRFGAPLKLVSDLGKQFTSNLILSLCEIFNVKKHFTSAYHPQSNSFCERNNRTILQALRAYTDKEQNNWPKLIPGILMALRNSPCTQSTDHSPFYMVFGREMNLPFDIRVTPKDSLQADAKEHIRDILENLKITHEIAKENIAENQLKSKERYDARAKEPSFRLNQMVLLQQFKTPVGKSPKLIDKYDGPYYISELGPNFTYKLRRCSNHKELKSYVNASRLKDYMPGDDIRDQNPEQDIGILFDENTQDNQNDLENGQDNLNVPNDDNQDTVDRVIDNTYYPVDKVIKIRNRAGKREFFVKWEDGTKSWEPEENLSQELVREYFVKHTKQGKKRKFPTTLKKP